MTARSIRRKTSGSIRYTFVSPHSRGLSRPLHLLSFFIPDAVDWLGTSIQTAIKDSFGDSRLASKTRLKFKVHLKNEFWPALFAIRLRLAQHPLCRLSCRRLLPLGLGCWLFKFILLATGGPDRKNKSKLCFRAVGPGLQQRQCSGFIYRVAAVEQTSAGRW